jgi:hypothetical protein
MTNMIVALLFACSSLVTGPATVTVQLAVRDDQRASRRIREIAIAEASAIWSEYGVTLVRGDSDAPATFMIDVAIESTGAPTPSGDGPRVLGQMRPAAAASEPDHILVSLHEVRSLLKWQAADQPLLPDEIAARALGRVLAHEVGHVLLGPQHDASGLMQPVFASSDLAAWERTRFRLTKNGIDRLKRRAGELAQGR